MKISRKFVNYMIAILLLVCAAFILPVLEKLLPDGRDNLYVAEGAVGKKDQHNEAVKLSPDGLLANFLSADDFADVVQVRDYDFIRTYVNSCMECLTVSEDLPADGLELKDHVFYDENKKLIYIYDVEYYNSDRGKLRLDMCFAYEGRVNIRPSLKYYFCRPISTGFSRTLAYENGRIKTALQGMAAFIVDSVTNYETNVFEKGRLAVFIGLDSETVAGINEEYYNEKTSESYNPLYFLLWRFCEFEDGLCENIQRNESDASSVYLEKMRELFVSGFFRVNEYKDNKNSELGLELFAYRDLDNPTEYDKEMTFFFNPVSGTFTGVYFE